MHEEHDFKDSLFGALLRKPERLSSQNPDAFATRIAPYECLSHRTIAVMLLSGWAANPRRFAENAVKYILERPNHLCLGYLFWSGGDGRCAITRAVLKA